MTTTPTPTGKIKGSLQEVMPKLRNFVGAVKVTTPKGKGGILMEMGRPVASYLTHDGVLHKGRESLDLLGEEPLAEFEILRYDDEQYKEARIICDNRGLLLGEEREAPGMAPPQAREAKPREEKPAVEKPREEKPQDEEKNLLSSMMRRFASPKPPAKREAARDTPKAVPAGEPLPAVPPAMPPAEAPAAGLPVPRPPVQETGPVPYEKKDAAPVQDTDLSAIIRRLRESKAEKGTPAPVAKAGEALEKPPVPAPAPVPVERAGPAEAPAGTGAAAAAAAAPPAGEKAPGVPLAGEPEGRVKVDLSQMMKRIKRLDITSIRKELEEGAPGGEPAGAGAPAAPEPARPAGEAAPAPAKAQAPAAEAEGKSDIDELKAFIRKLEVLEEPKEEPPSEKSLLGRLGVRAPAGESAAPPARREVPAPVPRKEKLPVAETPPEAPVTPEEKPMEKPAAEVPPVEKAVPRPPEPDRKAKIASLLRRSGLVRPPAEDRPKEIIAPTAEPGPSVQKEEAPAAPGEPVVQAPKPQKKKVEITLVPRKPEKPLREPPLIDEKALQKVLKQPGVIAVSTFFEGFAVQSAGRADFEQVAANAEDLFRAGKKIAREIEIGPLNQIILETGKGKLIIAPQGDLNIAIFTEPDANLGLIRMAIKGLQVEKD